VKEDKSGCWNVRDFGVVGDRKKKDHEAVQQTIDTCHEAGGGTVYFPPGDYLTGTLLLKDNVSLHIEAGATLYGSPDRADYTVPHLIYARDARNVSILGQGTIDGQGEAFWVRRDKVWHPSGWRPECLIDFVGCRNVLLRDITIINSPAWTVHLFRCDGANMRGVTIQNDIYSPNTDGIDPNCSKNIHISDCHIITGDDCIVLKATEPYPCENITITNCTLETTCTALKLGTESYGNIRHCTFSNCTIRNSRIGIGIFMKDGGTMEGVSFSNMTIETKADRPGPHEWPFEWPIFIDLERRSETSKKGFIRDVMFDHLMILTKGRCLMQGMTSHPLERLTLDNVTVRIAGFQKLSDVVKPRAGKIFWDDPEAGLQRQAPAHIVFSNVRGLRLRDVEVTVEAEEKAEERSAIFGDALAEVEISGFRGMQSVPDGDLPAMDLHNCRNVLICGCRASAGTGTFLRLNGTGTSGITMMGNDLSSAGEAVSLDNDVREGALYQNSNREFSH
jgi:polygalacturonase